MTRALAVKAAWIVGSAARILASLVTTPSLIGHVQVLAYQHPLAGQILARHFVDVHALISAASQAAFDQARVVSSIRLEKPHSLSYQAHTLTSVPWMTLVSVAS